MSNIFGYQKTFDASGCQTNCPHTIGKYIWNFGDGSPPETTNQKKITHYFSKRGKYNVTLTVEATCPQFPPNTATSPPQTASVGLGDLTVIKFIWKNKRTIMYYVIRIVTDHALNSISESPDNIPENEATSKPKKDEHQPSEDINISDKMF
ncbi:MAG: PKD domain-containing protein [Euryarchaeota archaeon]|nr:PKD domain-containing protein [Euryarchaeota archaeon]